MQDTDLGTILRHIAEIRRRHAANTATHRRTLLLRLAAAHPAGLFTITGTELDDWLDASHLQPRTRNVYVSEISTFYRWAIRHGYTSSNPAADATRLRAPRSHPRPISTEHLERALAAAGPRMRAWLSLMAYAGMRCCEVAGLHAEDVLWHYSPPTLHLCHGTKGADERLVPLSRAAEAALAAWGLPPRGPVFPRADGSGPIPASYVSKRTAEHLHDLGLPWTAHSLRHFFGTMVYEQTRDLRATQELMGHADPGTTTIYVALVRSNAWDTVRGLGSST